MPVKIQPNVVFLVWDACRADYAAKHASNLAELQKSGVQFTNAIAPATWTQPSHASIFTGVYPHEHGITQPSQLTAPTDLIDQFTERDYSTYGVSGNGFISPLWGTDEAFKTFRYTQTPEPFPNGLDTYTFLRNHTADRAIPQVVTSVLNACLRHNHPIKSGINLGSVGINAFVRRYLPHLTRLPYQTFAPNPQHSYSPEKNTMLLEEMIRKEADSDRPFFVFANYMDTHRPYQAPADLQRKHLGRTVSETEFQRLNDDVAAPWEFIRLVQSDAVNDDDLETLRQLYAASVESVDRHLGQLLDALQTAGIREETAVVVVGDHGENLGKIDCMDRQRFGHEASISNRLAHVPFVISHPNLEEDIEDMTSVKSVYDFLLQLSDPDYPTDELDPREFTSEPVLCEYPALADEEFYETYPDIERQYARQRVSMDSVAAYEDDWRVVIESDGTELGFHDGQKVDLDELPSELIKTARDACSELSDLSEIKTTSETESQLKELGYL